MSKLCWIAFLMFNILLVDSSVFKYGKKKKFMEGFLMGFVIGNQFAASKGSLVSVQSLAKAAMPLALKGTGVNQDDLKEIMAQMQSNSDEAELSKSKSLVLRRAATPRKILVAASTPRIRIVAPPRPKRIVRVRNIKYPVFVRDSNH